MKILMINKFLYPKGGSETYIFKLGEALKQSGHIVSYFGMEHPDNIVGNDLNLYVSKKDFHQDSLAKRLTYPLKTIYSNEAKSKLTKLLEYFQPEICHLNNFNYQLTPSIIEAIEEWKKKTGHLCKIIYTAHDYQLLCPNHMFYQLKAKHNCDLCIHHQYYHCLQGRCIHHSLLRSLLGSIEGYYWYYKRIYTKIDLIITPSAFMQRKFEEEPLFQGKCITLHNFIDRIERKETNKENYILYFGRYEQEKGIEAIISIAKKRPDIPFVFCGSGMLEDKLEGIPNIQNKGFLTGRDLENVIRKAQFTIYPSLWQENCPFSIMESIMYGTPVVGANIGGIPELIQDHYTGRLFESGNEQELMAIIDELVVNKELCNQYAKNTALIHFDTVEKYCKKYIQVIQGGKI